LKNIKKILNKNMKNIIFILERKLKMKENKLSRLNKISTAAEPIRELIKDIFLIKKRINYLKENF